MVVIPEKTPKGPTRSRAVFRKPRPVSRSASTITSVTIRRSDPWLISITTRSRSEVRAASIFTSEPRLSRTRSMVESRNSRWSTGSAAPFIG